MQEVKLTTNFVLTVEAAKAEEPGLADSDGCAAPRRAGSGRQLCPCPCTNIESPNIAGTLSIGQAACVNEEGSVAFRLLVYSILGDITDEKLDILRRSDFILRDEIAKAGLDRSVWQYFTVFTGIRSVGVMGDQRTYDYAIGVRAVTSTDAMTVEFAELPYDLLRTISNRIIAETPHVNRVMFDITDKPPGTIEWE